MSVYVIAYTAVLIVSGAISFGMGEPRDRLTWSALATAAVLSHYSLVFGVKTALALHAVAYMMMAFASFTIATRLHGDIVGITFAVASAFGFLALGGVLPYDLGKGISWNFWNIHTIIFYAANAALVVGIWLRWKADGVQ